MDDKRPAITASKIESSLPPALLQVLQPTAKIGILSGAAGVFYGASKGILRVHKHPIIFTITSGIAWACMGSTFWATRGFLFQAWNLPSSRPHEQVSATSIAAGASGLVGGLLKGQRRALPYMLLFTPLGALGQYVYNRRTPSTVAHEPQHNESINESGMQTESSWLSRWSPVKPFPEIEYEQLLLSKLKSIDEQLQEIDAKIHSLKNEQLKMDQQRVSPGHEREK